MTVKPPTPQVISALLKKAGFLRAARGTSGHSGFAVTRSRRDDAAVWVTHKPDRYDATEQHYKEQLRAYGQVIADAGWAVDVKAYELIVTAGGTKEG